MSGSTSTSLGHRKREHNHVYHVIKLLERLKTSGRSKSGRAWPALYILSRRPWPSANLATDASYEDGLSPTHSGVTMSQQTATSYGLKPVVRSARGNGRCLPLHRRRGPLSRCLSRTTMWALVLSCRLNRVVLHFCVFSCPELIMWGVVRLSGITLISKLL